MAYADFVTAMMALFIVLWLLNSSQKVQKAVGGYFKDFTGTSKMVGTDMVGSGENFIVSKDNMQELKEQLQKGIREVPKFDELQNHIDMTFTNEGLRIELTESAVGTFFDSGSARMSGDGGDILKALAAELGKLPNKMAIEGHTDSKRYPPTANYTNWELFRGSCKCGTTFHGNQRIVREPDNASARLRRPAPAQTRRGTR